jgi:putative selenium metabolism hydrolase
MHNLIIHGQEVTNDLLAFTQALIRTQSYSGQEGPAARLVAEQMKALGFDDVKIDRYGNVVGRVGEGERVILFDSHTDTVAVKDAELWSAPPFSGEIRDGYVWGRGSVDMKSGLAASIYAAAIAKNQGLLNGKTVYVTGTVAEEDCDGEGLQHALAEGSLHPDYAVICEPSSNTIITGHKGKAQLIVRTQGISAHGSAPEKGQNAVYEMAEIIQRVEQTNQALMREGTQHGTLVLAQISSTGVSLNAVPSACEIYLDRRLALGETEQTVRDEMERIITGKRATWEIGALLRMTWTGEMLNYQPLHIAWEIRLEHPLAQALSAAYAGVYGHTLQKYEHWDFSTNAVATVSRGIPTIGFGPGDPKLAHMRDERCAVDQIVEACAIYAWLIDQL